MDELKENWKQTIQLVILELKLILLEDWQSCKPHKMHAFDTIILA